MAIKIGGAWKNITDEGREYIKIKIDEAFCNGILITEKSELCLWTCEKTKDNSPDFLLYLSKSKQNS